MTTQNNTKMKFRKVVIRDKEFEFNWFTFWIILPIIGILFCWLIYPCWFVKRMIESYEVHWEKIK